MKPVDLILCGSVAVRRDGARVGKGGGYSDLEYALGLESHKIKRNTPVVTTVHPLQIAEFDVELQPHDIPVDFIITPEEIIECNTRLPKPRGIYWEFLDRQKIESIPILREMKTKYSAKYNRLA